MMETSRDNGVDTSQKEGWQAATFATTFHCSHPTILRNRVFMMNISRFIVLIGNVWSEVVSNGEVNISHTGQISNRF